MKGGMKRGMKRGLLLFVLLCQLLLACPVQADQYERLYDSALQASQTGDFQQALPLWNQVLTLQPSDAAALSNRGNVREPLLYTCVPSVAEKTRNVYDGDRDGDRRFESTPQR